MAYLMHVISLSSIVLTRPNYLLVHGQVTIIFIVSVCLFVCLFVFVFLSRL